MSTSPALAAGISESTGSGAPRVVSLRVMWLLFAAEILANLLLQLPGVADFQKFGFYDEGSWLRLDSIVAQGAVPTVDIGYSYGMLPLLLGRGWFVMFGRTPFAFIGFVCACNLLAAWGVARILQTAGATRRRVAAAMILLPLAIFPNNYSLMHPLEMLLIISALAQQARGRYGGALVFATLAVLTKPSMGYVLGLVLLILGLWAVLRPWTVAGEPPSLGDGVAAPRKGGGAGAWRGCCGWWCRRRWRRRW